MSVSKSIHPAVAVLLLACAGSPPGDTGPGGADLSEVVVTMTEAAWNEGRVGVLDTTMADSVTFHYHGTPREVTREQMAATVLRWREAFAHLEMRIDETVREDDLVAARMTLSGRHEGRWLDVPPTGRSVSMTLMIFFRFEGERVVEMWESDDRLGLRRQLGLEGIPPRGRR